jgi:predicted nucleic acid-binding protein
VINTSPWIALSICKQTSLLNKLYDEVFIPQTVKAEILAGGTAGVGVKELNSSSWIKIESVDDAKKVKLLYELERGEAEVIVLAMERSIKQVLIDEKIARLQAKVFDLDVVGTLGLLLKAKKKGLVEKLKPLIDSIVEGGYWIKEDLVEAILKEAEE